MKTPAAILLMAVAAVTGATAQDLAPADALFPRKGALHATVLVSYSTETPPPAVIADAVVGISPRFSAGVVVGTTGALGLFGIRCNAALLARANYRLAFRFLSVCYPERDGAFLFDRRRRYVMPWMLSMAVVELDHRWSSGIRVSGGIGLLETHCIDDMKMWFNPRHEHHARQDDGSVSETLIDVYETVNASVSVPLSRRLIFRPEAFAVFRRLALIEKGRHKVTFPVNAYLSFTYRF